MPIPDYQTLMLPFLQIASDGLVHPIRDVKRDLDKQFALDEGERKELLPSGNQTRFNNRVGWARTYLKKAGLIQYVQRGHLQITDAGMDVLKNPPARITVGFLKTFEAFRASSVKEIANVEQSDAHGSNSEPENLTPDELIETGYRKGCREVEEDLLKRVKSCSPEFFEELVVKLLIAMGYGGSLEDAGEVTGQSGDGGIDGVIREDKLGLEQIYIQAKRWDKGSVGRPEIQKFVGALHGKRARKGVFLATSTFTADAEAYARSLELKVVLIDGAQLAKLMFEHGVGTTTERTYVVKRIDANFFEDE